MNPTNPSSDSASTGTTAAEQFLAAEVAATRRALQRTRIAGVIIVAVVAIYMTVVTRGLVQHLEPKSAAEFATTFAAGQVTEKADALASQVRERIPALVAGLPDYLQRELPRHREALEDMIERDVRHHSQTTAQQLGKHLDDFLQAHTVQIRTVLNTTENKPESLQALAPDLEQEILRYLADKAQGEESLKDKIDHALAELKKVEQQVDRLAKGVNLTPQEKKLRHAIAVVGRSAEDQTKELQLQIQDALRKAK